MKTSRKFKELEKLVKKHFDNVKWNDKENRWSALTKPNPNDPWEKPLSLSKFEKEADSKFYFYMSGTSWDDEGNVDIKVRENIFESNMKHIQAFESFKKGYGEKIKQSDFKEIQIGKYIQYGGGRHEVIDNDGYILTLKGNDGKLTKVNLNQFNDKGAINEARSIEKIEKDRAKVIKDMAEIVSKWKSAKENGDKKSESLFLQKLKDLTAKKKGLESELNDKILSKDKDLELIITEEIKVFESLSNPHEKTAKGLADKIHQWYDWYTDYIDDGSQRRRAIQFNENVVKWFGEHSSNIKKEAYKILQSKLGKEFDSKLKRIFEPTLKESAEINEKERQDKTFFDEWQTIYGENFIKEYPKLAKLIKMHPAVDAKTLSKWWDEVYGEDFKEKYPAMWDKLNKK